MKNRILIAIVIIASISWNISNAQVQGGFKMGVDFSNQVWTLDGDKLNDTLNTKRLISPRIGFIIEVPINDYLFVQSGLFGCFKGFRFDGERLVSGKMAESKEYELLLLVDLPINFGYKYDLGDAKLFAMAGPVISYATYATLLYKVDNEWDNEKQTIGTSDTDTFKPWSLGVNIEGGVEVNRFQFSIFYTQGLSNLTAADDMKIKTNVFGLTAAIKFGSVNGGGYRYGR
ncbi:MAG TPA: outer membrane beta-barrel protein [Bacteroidales bacterium]|jgi:hypothetical protein|nr:hypothetical protein [Bacteroidota bacterium]HJN05885.1 outer membrane beta-barrel protein [Bacteroidales bacterium]|tara:strand:- start:616 stop:1305 length:690 start_codon:yes stop_codon:yes gene_type:complete